MAEEATNIEENIDVEITEEKIQKAAVPQHKRVEDEVQEEAVNIVLDNEVSPVTEDKITEDFEASPQVEEKSKDLSQQLYSKAKFMGKHCQGQIEIKPDGISPTIRAEHHGNIEFRRLSKKNGGILSNELSKGLKERRLTPRECALIQTFPPDYEFVIANKQGRKGSYLVSPSKAYKVIGNAVPPLLAYNLAKRIENVWDLYFKK
jgi:site-specific DNA-cytosine methylase